MRERELQLLIYFRVLFLLSFISEDFCLFVLKDIDRNIYIYNQIICHIIHIYLILIIWLLNSLFIYQIQIFYLCVCVQLFQFHFCYIFFAAEIYLFYFIILLILTKFFLLSTFYITNQTKKNNNRLRFCQI